DKEGRVAKGTVSGGGLCRWSLPWAGFWDGRLKRALGSMATGALELAEAGSGPPFRKRSAGLPAKPGAVDEGGPKREPALKVGADPPPNSPPDKPEPNNGLLSPLPLLKENAPVDEPIKNLGAPLS